MCSLFSGVPGALRPGVALKLPMGMLSLRRRWSDLQGGRAGMGVVVMLVLGVILLAGCTQGERTSTAPPLVFPSLPTVASPPVVVAYSPGELQELAAGEPIVVRFDRPMEPESTQAAFHLDPEMEGQFEWVDGVELRFMPEDLAAGARYQALVDRTARSLDGVALSRDLTFAFQSQSLLQVTHVTPADKAVGVRGDQPLLIEFSLPVAADSCLGSAACQGPTTSISPAVAGSGFWVNPALYRFDPDDGWEPGTTYEIRIEPQGIGDDAVPLGQRSEWRFVTAAPAVIAVAPASEAVNVAPSAAIVATFSTPMDREMTGSALRVVDAEGDLVAGGIAWHDGGTRAVFTPVAPLSLASWYTVSIGSRARAQGSTPIVEPMAWRFRTVGRPQVLAILPADGTEVSQDEPVRILMSGDIDEVSLAARIVISPSIDTAALQASYDPDARVYTLFWAKGPQTETCVTVIPGVRDLYGNTLDEGASSCFRVHGLEPTFDPEWAGDEIALSAYEAPVLSFRSRNTVSVVFSLYALDEAAFVERVQVAGRLLRSWIERPAGVPDTLEAWPVTLSADAAALNPGLYRLTWNPRQDSDTHSAEIAVVDTHVSLWVAHEEALVWVTALSSGEPLTRTAVRLVDGEGLLVAGGTTDADGVAHIPISRRGALWERLYAVVGEPGASGFGISATHWQVEGVTPQVLGAPVDYLSEPSLRGFLTLGSQTVGPGQDVQIRGLFQGTSGTIPNGVVHSTAVLVRIQDPTGNTIFSETEMLSEAGMLARSVRLPADAPEGTYVIEAAVDGEDTPARWRAGFLVRASEGSATEYRIVSLLPAAPDWVVGEVLSATVQVYGWDGPVAEGTPLSWQLWAVPQPALGVDAEGWIWGAACPPADDSRPVIAGVGVTDAGGSYVIELPTRSFYGGACVPALQEFVIVAVVTGTGEEARATVRVHAADLSLGLKLRERIVPESGRSAVSVAVQDLQGHAMAGQTVELTLAKRSWQLEPNRLDALSSTWVCSDTLLLQVSVTTDESGHIMVPFTVPGAGTYAVTARATDAAGRPAEVEGSIWAGGESGGDWSLDRGALGLVPDKLSYQVGDRAVILVTTLYSDVAQVLVSVQGDGILTAQRFDVEGQNALIELPILEEYAPGAYVSVVAVPSAAQGLATQLAPVSVGMMPLEVASRSRRLGLMIEADRIDAAPGDTLALRVRVSDRDGTALQTEVGVIAVETSRPITVGVAPADVETAFFGLGPLRVAMGDSLIGVSAGQLGSLGRVPRGSSSVESLEPALRPDLGPRVLWVETAATDETGLAEVDVVLPEGTAEWRFVALAADGQGAVGVAEMIVRSGRQLSVTPLGPSVLSPGDRTMVAALLRNEGAATVDARVQLEAGSALSVEERSETLTLPPYGIASVAWPIGVSSDLRGVVTATLVVEVSGNTTLTPLEIELREPIPPSSTKLAGVMEAVEAEHVELFWVPEADTTEGALTVRVDDSLAAVIAAGLAYLEQYPAVSTELLVNRLHAAVHAARAYGVVEQLPADMAVEASWMARQTMDQLCVRRSLEGGWGRWESDGDAKLTALELLALSEAQESGLASCAGAIDTSAERVAAELSRADDIELGSQDAQALFALTVVGRTPPLGLLTQLYSARESLGIVGQAYLAMAMARVDRSDPRIETLMQAIRTRAIVKGESAHWAQTGSVCWDAEVAATAMVVRMLLDLAPDDELIAPAVEWLLASRSGNAWVHPSLTTNVLIALARYVEQSSDLQALGGTGTPCGWSVTVNDAQVLAGSPCGENASPGSAGSSVVVVAELLPGANEVQISQPVVSNGALIYSLELSTYPEASSLLHRGRGLTLLRSFYRAGSASELQSVRSGELLDAAYTLILSRAASNLVLLERPSEGLRVVDGMGTSTAYILCSASGIYAAGGAPVEGCRAADTILAGADGISVFYGDVPAGVYRMMAPYRAGLPGDYAVPSASAYTIFPDDIRGYSNPGHLTVLP